MFPCHRRAKRQESPDTDGATRHYCRKRRVSPDPGPLGPAARRRAIVAAAFDGETKTEIDGAVDEVEWIKLGQLNKLIEVFTSRGVKRAVMAGGITPPISSRTCALICA